MEFSKILGLGFGVLVGVVSQAKAQETLGHDEYLTGNLTVVCANPFMIEEAEKAVGDKAWLDQTGCIVARPDMKVIVIEGDMEGYDTWQVRIPEANVTAWTPRAGAAYGLRSKPHPKMSDADLHKSCEGRQGGPKLPESIIKACMGAKRASGW